MKATTHFTKLFLFFITCACITANAQTNVSGFINANTTWTLAGSPYIVVGNALLSHGYTLTIDPGVIVKFNDSTVLQIDGELDAIGNAANRITFTSNQISPAPGDWGKVHFSDTCVDAVFDTAGNYVSGSIMKYCDVMYGGELGYGEIHIADASPYFSHCSILNSSADGIYCLNTGYIIDYSLIKSNNGRGLYFYDMVFHSCSLLIINDSIVSNNTGGVFIGPFTTSTPCNGTVVEVLNNYFLSNSNGGAIELPDNWGIHIKENYFIANSSTSGGIINSSIRLRNYNIECNHFLNNSTNDKGVISIHASGDTLSYIRNNHFENNNSNSYASVLNIDNNNCVGLTYIVNNFFKNNICANGACCLLGPCMASASPKFYFNYNEFDSNTANNLIVLTSLQLNNSTWNSLSFKHNNFLNNNVQYDLYNAIPYGSPNIYADSNYWSSLNTQHMDSVIYDYFDYGNLSVVYYSPFLHFPVEIDTACPPPITTSIQSQIINHNSKIYPNPFSTSTTLTFSTPLHDATLRIYNMYGQMMQQREHVSGREITVQRENLCCGIYIYEVSEAGRKITAGKAVVY